MAKRSMSLKKKKDANLCYKTLKVRVRDTHATLLNKMAFEVNQVWNAVNQTTYEAYYIPIPPMGFMNAGDWLSAFDLHKQFSGFEKEWNYTINSSTVQAIITENGKARQQFKKCKLLWRTGKGSRKNMGQLWLISVCRQN